ncbi:HAD-IA family hydrolase [Rhizobium sp. LjRoot30]|uniref:HAD family hydrolase n=1 Tax=Rhizobium sp. LjRoot30 TaxID=3342320 RepID=UPI003ECFAAAB
MPYLDRFKTIIFDFDGVILDSARLKTMAFAEAYNGEPPEKLAEIVAYQQRHGGIGRRQKFEYFEREIFGRPGDEAAVNRLCDRFGQIIEAGMLSCACIPGAEPLLARLENVVPMHVVSGMPEEDLKIVIERRGLSRYFRTVSGSPRSKHAEFLAIMQMENARASECLAVGDSLTEFHAARKIGIPFLAIVAPDVADLFPTDVKKTSDLTDFEQAARRAW